MKKAILIIFIIIVFIIVIFKVFDGDKIILRKIYPDTYLEYVDKYAQKYEIEKEWVFALIKAESNFEKSSVSQSGAVRTYAAYGEYCRRDSKRGTEEMTLILKMKILI